MSKKKNSGVVPRLRFPEFREAGAWQVEPLTKLAKRCTAKNTEGKHTRVLTNSAEHGVIDQRDYFEKDIANQGNLEGYYIVEKEDYVYNPRISVSAPVGPLSKNNIGTGVMSPLYTVFRFASSKNDFYAHYFKSTSWHHYMRQSSSTGARHDRMSITNDDFMRMPLPVPGPKEQEKITDCLSSLDGLISLEAQKLDALKAHKKGLMQQLFPGEGETVPRLRFPAFRDAAEWETKAFREVISHSFYGTSSSTSDSGAYPVLRMGNMVDGGINTRSLTFIDLSEDEFKKFQLKRGDILLNRTNSPDLVGKISLFELGGDYIAASYIVAFRLKTAVLDPTFCNYLLNSDTYQARIKGFATRAVSQANINPTVFQEKLAISLPSPLEQKRVADCLSHLDKLINAQAQKLDALKTHKKGLTQQLFPMMDEVR